MRLNNSPPPTDTGFQAPAFVSHRVSSKIFDLSHAPRDLQEFAESQFLRGHPGVCEVPTVEVWITAKTATIEPPASNEGGLRVTAWEHLLHGWLSRAGATSGDVVHLIWTSPPSA